MKRAIHQLSKIRELLDYPQEAMAEKLNMTQPNYNRIENGKQSTIMEHIFSIIVLVKEVKGMKEEDIFAILHGIHGKVV